MRILGYKINAWIFHPIKTWQAYQRSRLPIIDLDKFYAKHPELYPSSKDFDAEKERATTELYIKRMMENDKKQ